MASRPLPFDNQYITLPKDFYAAQAPTPVSSPAWIVSNEALAKQLGIDTQWFSSDAALNTFAGQTVPEGAQSIATIYAGHQFGNFNPQLGDGRAVLLGDLLTPNGKHVEMQLKGSGPTPFSRSGDGRAPIGPVIREYVVSEAMAALGVPTTRALAAVATGDPVYREQVEPGGVICRIASSHIRVGTFELFASRGQTEQLKQLANYVINRHYPGCKDSESPYVALYSAVIKAQASLVAHWQSLGFVHGVMNTDNMLVCGETVDYGPCAFIDTYKANAVYSAIDRGGRYALNQQASIAHWNLLNLGQCLLPLFDEDQQTAVDLAQPIINEFKTHYETAYYGKMSAKLGLTHTSQSRVLADDFLNILEEQQLDYTLTLREFAEFVDGQNADNFLPKALDNWLSKWQVLRKTDATEQSLCQLNPAIIPRNHWVQHAITEAYEQGTYETLHQLLDAIKTPFAPKESHKKFTIPPTDSEKVARTFCGT